MKQKFYIGRCAVCKLSLEGFDHISVTDNVGKMYAMHSECFINYFNIKGVK